MAKKIKHNKNNHTSVYISCPVTIDEDILKKLDKDITHQSYDSSGVFRCRYWDRKPGRYEEYMLNNCNVMVILLELKMGKSTISIDDLPRGVKKEYLLARELGKHIVIADFRKGINLFTYYPIQAGPRVITLDSPFNNESYFDSLFEHDYTHAWTTDCSGSMKSESEKQTVKLYVDTCSVMIDRTVKKQLIEDQSLEHTYKECMYLEEADIVVISLPDNGFNHNDITQNLTMEVGLAYQVCRGTGQKIVLAYKRQGDTFYSFYNLNMSDCKKIEGIRGYSTKDPYKLYEPTKPAPEPVADTVTIHGMQYKVSGEKIDPNTFKPIPSTYSEGYVVDRRIIALLGS